MNAPETGRTPVPPVIRLQGVGLRYARTQALEGIDAQPGQDLLLATDPAEFLDAVRRASDDADGGTLQANARKCVEDKYSWDSMLRGLDRIIDDLSPAG